MLDEEQRSSYAAYTVSQFIVRAAAKTARDCIDSSEICFARNALKTKLILKTFPPAEHERENLVCSENNRETKNKAKILFKLYLKIMARRKLLAV